MGHNSSCLSAPVDWKHIEKTLKEGDYYQKASLNNNLWVEKLDLISKKFDSLEKELKREDIALFDGLKYVPDKSKMSKTSKSPLLFKEVQCKTVNFTAPKDPKKPEPTPIESKTTEAKIVACRCGRKRVVLDNEAVPTCEGSPSRSSLVKERPQREHPAKSVHFVDVTSAPQPTAKPLIVKMESPKKPAEPRLTQDDGLLSKYLSKFLKESSDNDTSSILQWLHELREVTDDECVNAMHSKGLTRDPELLSIMSARNARDTIFLLQQRADAIVAEFSSVIGRLGGAVWLGSTGAILGLCNRIQDLLKDYQVTAGSLGPVAQQAEAKVTETQEQLQAFLKCCKEDEDDKTTVLEILKLLGEDLKNLMEALISQELSVILQTLKKTEKIATLKVTALSVAELAQAHPHLADLCAKMGTVGILASRCENRALGPARRFLLRALTWICASSSAGASALERAGGVGIISSILSSHDVDSASRCEAAGLLATVHTALTLGPHVDSLITSLMGSNDLNVLIDLTSGTGSSETFLVATAALARLSFHSSDAMAKQDVVSRLVASFEDKAQHQTGASRRHLATIVANLPLPADRSATVALLVRFLVAEDSEVTRAAAVALARLSADPSLAVRVSELGGVKRLVTLCRDERARQHSDPVLLASLAALRRISASAGSEELKQLRAMDLIQPRLWDSFVICSARQESYV